MNATDYVTKFKILASQARIFGDNAKVMFFQKGLNSGLRTKIYGTHPLPKTFDEWCERATTMDAQWRASNTSSSGTRNKSSNWRNRSNNTTQVKAVNLSFQDRQRYIQEGRCFRCDQIGHRAADPKFHPKNNQGNQNNNRNNNNPFRQQIRQTTVDNQSASNSAQRQNENLPQGKDAIQELVRKIQNMSNEDQDTVLEMFGEMEDAAGTDNEQDF